MKRVLLGATALSFALAAPVALAQDTTSGGAAGGSTMMGAADITCDQIAQMDADTLENVLYFIAGHHHAMMQSGMGSAAAGGGAGGMMPGFFTISAEDVLSRCQAEPTRRVADILGEQGGAGGAGTTAQ